MPPNAAYANLMNDVRQMREREPTTMSQLANDLHSQPRIDEARLHADRLERTCASLREHGLAAALLFDTFNLLYATVPSPATVWNLHSSFRYALVPVESVPALWEYEYFMPLIPDHWQGEVHEAVDWNYFGAGSNTIEEARRFASQIARALEDRGLTKERLGIDRLDAAGYAALGDLDIELADAQPALEIARAVKTPDEVGILRANARTCDAAVNEMRQRLEPGVTENQLWGTFIGSALQGGAHWAEGRFLASGPRTNPWFHDASNRVLEAGDLVALDTDLIGDRYYITDISRTYLCGDVTPTDEQRRLYQTAYDFVEGNIAELSVGASFEELGRRFAPRLPAEFQAQRYPIIAHGSPMGEGYPCIKYDGHHDGEVEAGMVFSVEAYVGAVGGREGVKLEEQIIVTDAGPEILSVAPYDDRLLA